MICRINVKKSVLLAHFLVLSLSVELEHSNTKKIIHCLKSRLHFNLQELVYLANALLIQSPQPFGSNKIYVT